MVVMVVVVAVAPITQANGADGGWPGRQQWRAICGRLFVCNDLAVLDWWPAQARPDQTKVMRYPTFATAGTTRNRSMLSETGVTLAEQVRRINR